LSDQKPIIRVSEPHQHKEHGSALARVLGTWLVWIIVIAAAVGGVGAWGWLNFTAPGPLTAPKIVQLPAGADHSALAIALKDAGVISNAAVFAGAAALQEMRHAKLKSGEYEFPAGASMDDVLAMIIRGQFVTYKVTIPEGWTSQMVVDRMNGQDFLSGTIDKTPDEGTLLPETYVVTRGYPRQKLLEDMAAAQDKYLQAALSSLDPNSPIKSKQDLVTMASVVERETGVPEERPVVAAVFLNRLNSHMRLQSDPTVIYGIAGGKGKLDHPLTRDELDAPTPYNTYTNDGLPAGPIGNPGKASLDAVVHPANVKYLYFVANGMGGHAFAATLDEHNANVKKWRALNTNALPGATPPPAKMTAQPVPQPNAAATANTIPAPVVTPTDAPAATAAPAAAAAPAPAQTMTPKKIPLPIFKKPKKPATP